MGKIPYKNGNETGKGKDKIVKWKHILEDTPPKLDLDFASQVQPSYSVQHVNMDKRTVSQMNDFCQEKKMYLHLCFLCAACITHYVPTVIVTLL